MDPEGGQGTQANSLAPLGESLAISESGDIVRRNRHLRDTAGQRRGYVHGRREYVPTPSPARWSAIVLPTPTDSMGFLLDGYPAP